MITGKTLLILGIAIALTTLVFGLIYAYFRTRLRQTPGLPNYNQGVARAKRGTTPLASRSRTRSTSAGNTKDKPQPPQTQPTAATNTAQKADYFLNQGLNQVKEGDYRGAIADFNQALQINPNDAELYHNRGNARFKLGEIQAAMEDFTQALRLNPDYAEAYVGRGNAYHKLGNNQGAVIYYTQLLRLNPKDAKAYYNRGVAQSKRGEQQRAIEDYQKAVKLFYEQGDEVNCKRAVENLDKLQPPTPSKSAVNANTPFKPSSTSPRSSSKASSGSQDNTIRLEQASSKLQNQLLRLLHDDRELAIRLLFQVKTNNPGKPVD